MAMTLPIVIPSTPTSSNSPAADGGEQPRTPASPTSQPPAEPAQQAPQAQSQEQDANSSQQAAPGQQALNGANAAQVKRKPSRRANTAERRATHNAVERQRRETLNGRFLDLAALLPNLSQIRRPSKSSIVNSSIAHIQASRRHRIVAARELRLLKLEADALRRELNEWRDRAGIPRIEEPIRGEAFSMVLSGEVEVVNTVAGEEEEDDLNGQYDDDEYMGAPQGMLQSPMVDDMDEHHRLAMMKSAAANANPFAHSLPPPVVPTSGPGHQGNGIHLSHVIPRPSQSGMMSNPPYDTPAAAAAMAGLYDHPSQYPSQFMHSNQGGPHHSGVDPEKLAAWNLYNQQQQQQQMLQAQRSLFTPPATSHGLPTPTSTSGSNASNGSGSPPGSGSPGSRPANGNPFNDPAFFVNLQRQQLMHGSNNGHGYTSAERDEPIPRGVNGANGPRERSGSVMSAGSGSGYGGSPPHHGGHGGASPVGGYELGPGSGGAGSGAPGVGVGESYGPSRRPGWSREVDMGVHGHHGHHPGAAGPHHGHHHHPIGAGMLPSPISAGGNGGGGGGFAMMM
ncbi:hypothetical protein AX16_000838 [Volvariella volvacea WC 439]|nr:hypothetical protein AX16_000838 [Volvariella volvacea WC 439]